MVTGRGFEPLDIRVKGARVNQFHQPVMAGVVGNAPTRRDFWRVTGNFRLTPIYF